MSNIIPPFSVIFWLNQKGIDIAKIISDIEAPFLKKEVHRYYRTRKENPLKKMQSVIAVACKVLRIFYTILTKGVTYDGAKMMQDIKRPQMLAA